MRLSLPQLLWYGNTTLELDFPDSWQVRVFPMRGAGRPPMDLQQMEQAVGDPFDSPRLSDLARGKSKAVILFDDMTRPTRVAELGPLVVRELLQGGLDEDHISFVCALGAHGPLSQNELRKKVGEELLRRFRVYNHNCYEHCVDLGTTLRGTKLMVNRHVMSADLKIGIGCVTAHAQTGFSGGGKIVLPGVSHIDSISHYHIDVQRQAPQTTGLGKFDNNVLCEDIAEAVRMAGLDFKIDVIVNQSGQTTHVFAGEVAQTHAAAVAVAKEHYALDPRPTENDVMVANAFAKPDEMAIAVLVGALGLGNASGTVAVIADAPEGQVVHYLLSRFGDDYGGRQYPIARVPGNLNLIIQAPHLDKTFGDWFANPDAITWTQNWQQTLALLRDRHGDHAKVGVVPNATMAYPGTAS